MPTLPDDLRALLDGPNYVHLGTVLPDGSPHVVVIWAGVERRDDGDLILFFTDPTSRKARNLERDPRVALSVVDFEDPYRAAWVRGRVVERRNDAEALVAHLSHVYTGKPYPLPPTNVVYAIEPERWEHHVDADFEHAPPAAG